MPETTQLLYTIATWLIPLMFAIVFHEVAHGWVANFFGDPTAKSLGRLTLNPIKHVDPIGTIGLPILLAVSGAPIFGWAKPVPIMQNRLRNPRVHMMAVAFAGPAMNLILGFGAVAVLGTIINMTSGGSDVSSVTGFILDNLSNFLLINVFLAIFNLIPLPPFDGSHIVEGLLPPHLAVQYRKLQPYGFPIIIILIVVIPMLFPSFNPIGMVVVPPVQAILSLYLGLFGLNA